MHNRLMSNVGPYFFFSDLSQFLHVGFVLVNKHCPVFFFAGLLTYAKKLSLPSGIFWTSFVERETKETFCFAEQDTHEQENVCFILSMLTAMFLFHLLGMHFATFL